MICGYTGADHKLAYLFENATEVSFTRILSSGTVIGTLSIDGEEITVYAPTAESGSEVEYTSSKASGTAIGTLAIDGTSYTLYCDEVSFAQTQTSGTELGTITINDTTYSIYGDSVSFSQAQTSGVEVGTLTINDTSYTLYAPEMNLYGTTAPSASEGENGAFYTYYDGTNTYVYVKSNGAWVQMFSSDASIVSL